MGILPENMKVSDIKWLSVWCRKFAVDFGNLMFPVDVTLPGSSALPAPIVPPSNDIDAKAEAEPGYEHGSNSIDADPKSEPSTKSEPEPEPKGDGTILSCSLFSILTVFALSAVL